MNCKQALFIVFVFFVSTAYSGNRLCFRFHGLQEKEVIENIRQKLKLNTHFCLEKLTNADLRQQYHESTSLIRQALEPFGYFKPVIDSHLQSTIPTNIAIVHIKPGPALKINTVSVEVKGPGKHNPAINHFINYFPVKCGDRFLTTIYNDTKRKLFKISRNEGYIKADFQNKIRINLKKYQCDIHMVLQTGDRYYFGPVHFKDDIYTTGFTRRFFRFTKRHPYSSLKLIHLQQDMEQSYYFRQVVINPDFDHIHRYHVPLDIEYTVPKRKKYMLGIGYSTLTGLRLSAGLSLRRVTRTGQHFESELQLSSIRSGIAANYYIPGKNPLIDTWVTGVNYKTFSPKGGDSESMTITAGYAHKKKHARFNMNLNFLIERFRIEHNPYQKSHELYPSFNFAYVKVDDMANPRHGYSILFNLRAASQSLLSTTGFIQPQAGAKWFISPFEPSRFILRGEAGYTVIKNLPRMPLTLRFFAGGINSIRGFADSSIGPGKYLLIGSAEYQHRLYKKLSGALFYDIGTAANHTDTPLSRGAGIGFVYHTPIGPARIYLARAISKQTQPYSIEFSIGPEFS